MPRSIASIPPFGLRALRPGALAAAVLAATGCGLGSDADGVAPGAPSVAGSEPVSRAASRVVRDVRSHFILAHHEMPDEHKSMWDEVQEEVFRKDDPALRDSPVRSFVRRADRKLAPVVRAEKARVSLAATADAATEIASVTSTVAIGISLEGARPQPAEAAEGYVVYRDGLGRGAHVIQRATEDGAEDYVLLPARPAVEELVYPVDVTRVAGVRVVPGANAVEFLSSDGTPRLHMAPPRLVDARGETLDASVEVNGCSYDTDPHAPWGRPVTAPGSTTCEVRVSWGGRGAIYPVLVDPAWTQTGVPLVARAWHQMVLLDDGTAMSLGAYLPSGGSAAMEIWNNGVWAAGSTMNVGRWAFQARKLDNGDVIAIGGGTTTSRWSKASATWVVDPGSDTKVAHGNYFGMAKLKNGKLLAVSISTGGGAASKDAELYDPVAKTWTVVANMNHAHGFLQNQVLGLPDGRAFVIGGSGPDGGVTEFYDPATNKWTDGPLIQQGGGRALGVALRLADGRIFISGVVRTVETLNLADANPAWKVSSPSPQLAIHAEHTAIQLLNGRVLLHGSYQAAKPESQTWDPMYDTWSIEAGITKVSDFPASVRFADARVLVTGGSAVVDNPSNNSPIAWLFGCTSDLDCGDLIPFCEIASGKCRACKSDNGSGGQQACQNPQIPFCDPSGACFPCTPADLSHCGPGMAACDAVSHQCLPCNGNNGSGTSAQCPDPLKRYCNGGTGLCDATCTSDAQCAASEFCNDLTPTGACQAKSANAQPIPGGACNAATGSRACVTGVCDALDLVCGVDLGHGDCATSAQCNVGVCVATGPNAAKCEACDLDQDCSAGTVCDSANQCVQCAPGKTANCAGETPVCDPATETCLGCLSAADCPLPSKPLCDPNNHACATCAGDYGQPGLSCPEASPLCSPTGACGKCATLADCAGGAHPGPICNPISGACGSLCTTDADCPGQWCDNPKGNPAAGVCAAKIANGDHLPANSPINGTCAAGVGSRVCASGVCDPNGNVCGLRNGDGPCTPADGGVVCIGGVCDPLDNQCGLADGSGPCTPATGMVVCRSNFCTVSGICEPAGACAVDGDCSAAQFCDTQLHTCTAKLANGAPIPSLTGHTPALSGKCSADVAAAVCVSGVCDPANDQCGLLNGDGPCTAASGPVVCDSAVCDPSDSRCGYLDDHGPCKDGGQCRSKVCGKDGQCGAKQDAGAGGQGGSTAAGGNASQGGAAPGTGGSSSGGASAAGGTSPAGSNAASAPGADGGCGCVFVGHTDDRRNLGWILGALCALGMRRGRRRRS